MKLLSLMCWLLSDGNIGHFSENYRIPAAVDYNFVSEASRITMFVYFFIIPVASVALFLFLWREGEISNPLVLGTAIVLSLAGQLLAPVYSPIWDVAALANIGISIYLAIRLKLYL